MKEELEKIKKEVESLLAGAKGLAEVLEIEGKYLGRKGPLALLMKKIKDLPLAEKKEAGSLANIVKSELQEKIKSVKGIWERKTGQEKNIDVTLPGTKYKKGSLHPITLIQKELEELFVAMGFMVLDGPELESDYYNFEALNIPKYHPARDMQDTFYIDQKNKDGEYDMVMRTHTSPVQVRAMQEYGAPLKGIVPGRVFRSEATDVRHEHTLYQLEGLMIDKDINFSHLKAMLEIVGKKLYGPETELRMRPKFYPFVEPGSNGEYTCFLCHGHGCKLCKQSGWLEILGCGMIHPNVLKAGGIDPDKYSGFAFGFGLSRLAQLKYGIEDCRLMMGGDLRFLSQF